MPVTQTAAPPPVRNAGSTAAPRKVVQSKTTDKHYADAAESALHLIATGAVLVGWHADAAAISMHAETIAPEVGKLASQNEKLAAGLDWIAESGPYAALIEACVVLGLQLAANHKLVKAEKLASAGIVSPDVLTAEMRAKMAETAAQALKKQKDAEARLLAAQKEIASTLNGQSPEPVGSEVHA